MHEAEKLSLDQIEAFLKASEAVRFEGENREQVYDFVEQVLRQQHYAHAGRKARGLVRRYLEKMTGLSRAQVTRLIARYRRGAGLELPATPLLATLYPRRCGAAGQRRRGARKLKRTGHAAHSPAQYQHYGKPGYGRLAAILVAHLYNLRRQPRYRERRLSYTKTKPTAVAIG